MKPLNNLSSDEMLPVHNVVLNLQNAILESKDVVVKSKQLSTPRGLRFEAVNETKVVMIAEIITTTIDGEKDDLMEQEKVGSVRTPNRSVRITIETL
tara:strand:- start:158 stop:448 length:291 start_codon:yes stop_codon:yes gene_type:complete